MGWEVWGSSQREGIYVYLWLIHFVIWQKSTQYCKAIILPLKINIFLKYIISILFLPICLLWSLQMDLCFFPFLLLQLDCSLKIKINFISSALSPNALIYNHSPYIQWHFEFLKSAPLIWHLAFDNLDHISFSVFLGSPIKMWILWKQGHFCQPNALFRQMSMNICCCGWQW